MTAALPHWRASFFRTAAGAEVDLVLELGRRRVVVECKASSAPEPTWGFWTAIRDLASEQAIVVDPVDEAYPIARDVAVVGVADLVAHAELIDGGGRHPALEA